MALIVLCSASLLLFEICGLADGVASSAGVCCSDVWLQPDSKHVDQMLKEAGLNEVERAAKVAVLSHTRVLYDTAKGPVLILKVAKFFLQVHACLFLALSHLVIWFFTEEEAYQSMPGPAENMHLLPGSRLTLSTPLSTKTIHTPSLPEVQGSITEKNSHHNHHSHHHHLHSDHHDHHNHHSDHHHYHHDSADAPPSIDCAPPVFKSFTPTIATSSVSQFEPQTVFTISQDLKR
jgi:hypothetical protein